MPGSLSRAALLLAIALFVAACEGGTAFGITSPPEDATMHDAHVTVSGTAPAGSVVTWNISLGADEHTNADSSGVWSFVVELKEGRNEFQFRLGDDLGTTRVLHLNYSP